MVKSGNVVVRIVFFGCEKRLCSKNEIASGYEKWLVENKNEVARESL